MTTGSANTARFWDRIAAKYAKKPIADEEAYRATLDRVRSFLDPCHQALEIGCGTGTTALHLAPHVGRLLATDLSAGMIDEARAKASSAGMGNVEFRTGTLDDGALEPEGFDIVMAFNLIHLLEDIPASVKRAAELIKPGGLLISKTPCIGEYSVLFRVLIPVMRFFGKAPFVNFVTKGQLERAVVDAGLSVLERGLYPAKSHSLFIVAQKSPG